MIKKIAGHFPRLHGEVQGEFMTRAHVQSAVEMHMITLCGDPERGGLTARCPYTAHGCLKVQAHLINRPDHPIGMIRDEVGHFFSSSASKSATRAALGCDR